MSSARLVRLSAIQVRVHHARQMASKVVGLDVSRIAEPEARIDHNKVGTAKRAREFFRRNQRIPLRR